MPRPPSSSNALSQSRPAPEARGSAAAALLSLVRGYQLLIRPLCPPSCRFVPSCSEYAHEAVRRHGAIRGSGLALRRVARCHPWHPGGWDPVPVENI